MSEELVAFVRARLDEDQAAAEAVLGVNVAAALKRGKPAPRWVPSPEGDAGIWDTNGTPRVKFVWARERDHIIRHDPARILVEVEAKRELVKLAARVASLAEECDPSDESWVELLEQLAVPYADHPDYRREWRPAPAAIGATAPRNDPDALSMAPGCEHWRREHRGDLCPMPTCERCQYLKGL